MKQNRLRLVLSLFSFSFSYACIYALVYIKYTLYDPLLLAFNITNAQQGQMIAVYTVVCMILYIPGGLLADRYSVKKILVISLFAHAVLCAAVGITMNFTVALVIWGLFGVTSAFAYWAALVKAVASLGDETNSARIFGIYALISAVISAAVNFLLVGVYGRFADPVAGMRAVSYISAAAAFLPGLLILFVYKDAAPAAATGPQEKFEFRYVGKVLRSPILWILSLCIFAVYGLRVAGNTYFNPFLTQVYGVDLESASLVGVVRSYVLPMLTPIAGFLADKVFKSTSKLLAFFFVVLAALFAFVAFMPGGLPLWLVLVISLLPGAISGMSYGVMFSVLREAKIPTFITGTVIGIISILGYTPDLLFPLFGSILDSRGNAGFRVLFLIFIVIAFFGIAACLYIRRYVKGLNEGRIRQIGADQQG